MEKKKIELTPVLRENIVAQVQAVLNRAHSHPYKRSFKQPRPSDSRLQIACPYCGDSHDDPLKKRGNIYWKNLYFHCFNGGCNRHCSITQFFKDFGRKLEFGDLLTVMDYVRENQVDFKKLDSLEFGLFKDLNDLAVLKEKFFTTNNVYPINQKTKRAYPFLKSRMLGHHLQYFGYDPRRFQLYILNLNHDGTKVLGCQMRNLEEKRFFTYDIERVRKMVGLETKVEDPKKLEKLKRLSTIFGILRTDMTRDFTVFEGPFDSLFIENSIALCGVGKQTVAFYEIPTVRYFFDNDKAGLKAAIDSLRRGCRIFLWNKFMKEQGLNRYSIKDLNDIVITVFKRIGDPKERSKILSNVKNYFSNDEHDIIYL